MKKAVTRVLLAALLLSLGACCWCGPWGPGGPGGGRGGAPGGGPGFARMAPR